MEMILQNVMHPTEEQQQQLISIEGLSIPAAAQMFDFCGDDGFFPETLQNSEVSSSSGCCFDENSYATDLSFTSFPFDVGKFIDSNNNENNNNSSSSSSSSCRNHSNNDSDDSLTIFLDAQHETEPDITASLPTFPIPPPLHSDQAQDGQFDISMLQSQTPLMDIISIDSGSSFGSSSSEVAPPPLLLSAFEEGCPSILPSYLHLDPALTSCSVLDDSGMGSFLGGNLNAGVSMEAYGMFPGNAVSESGFQSQELDFQGENGSIYACTESVYSSDSIQVFGENQQQLVVSGCGSPTRLTSDVSAFEESSFKVRRLSVEERKEKIHRYLKKRNERNFTKKIKYACRKTLADSRPRVRGRFAKNGELGEMMRSTYSNREDEDYDEAGGVREEREIHDCSEIFAHISGVNSFVCNYPIQSWM